MLNYITLTTAQSSAVLNFSGQPDVFLELISSFEHEIETVQDEEGKLIQKIKLPCIQRKDVKLAANIADFVDKYKLVSPQLNGFASFVKKISMDEYFSLLMCSRNDLTPLQIYILQACLIGINNGEDLAPELFESIDSVFGMYDRNYRLTLAAEKHVTGESNRKKRICRFCGKSEPAVTFRQRAHAIPEALGNKSIIGNEECDVCNQKFGKDIEITFIDYFGLARSLFAINGKNGSATLVGNGHELSAKKTSLDDNTPHFSILLKTKSVISKEDLSISFDANSTVCAQDIYRALCKFCIASLVEFDFERFKNLSRWILKEYDAEPKELPLVMLEEINEHYQCPQLAIFEKTSSNQKLPNIICEMRFIIYRIVFILPFLDDACEYRTIEDYDEVHQCFPFFKMANEQSLSDLSSTTAKKLQYNLNLVKQK